MNLGAFAVVIAVARKTRAAEISISAGSSSTRPGLTVLMTMFLFAWPASRRSAAGSPSSWCSASLLEPDVTAGGVALAVVVGVNSVIALFYYANVAKTMWMDPVPDDDRTPVRVPFSLGAALAISITLTIAFGVSDLVTRFGDLALFVHVALPVGRLARRPRAESASGTLREASRRGTVGGRLDTPCDAMTPVEELVRSDHRRGRSRSTRS